MKLPSEGALAAAAVALGARKVAGFSPAEERLVKGLSALSSRAVAPLEERIRRGADPLGSAFCLLRSPARRRTLGATYTPLRMVDAMLRWAKARGVEVARVVDPGVGSARFLARAGKAFPKAELVGIEVDPLAALVARANLRVLGLASRAEVIVGDYRSAELEEIDGRTLYVGNPPYVRHHLVEPEWKRWLVEGAGKLSCRASQLAGLHVYFFLATALRAREGDLGAFVTAAEWLDVNYGSLVRELFVGRLGGLSVTVVEPSARPFPDAQTTAAITTFEVEKKPTSVAFRRVATLAELGSLKGGRLVRRERLEQESRWSHLTRVKPALPEGFVELGELFRVHRGQVTGANGVWIAGAHSADLPERVQFATVTKARELIAAGTRLEDASALRRVIDLPAELAELDAGERAAVERFLKGAKAAGVDQGYVARNRKAWWSVGLREPAPILATYMARRPPVFVRNAAEARHINIAHGLYPRETFAETFLAGVAAFLSSAGTVRGGRTYAGGLTKFEPREMERLPVPTPGALAAAG